MEEGRWRKKDGGRGMEEERWRRGRWRKRRWRRKRQCSRVVLVGLGNRFLPVNKEKEEEEAGKDEEEEVE